MALDQSHVVAARHTGGIARAPSLAETALRAFVEHWRGKAAIANGPLRRLFWLCGGDSGNVGLDSTE